MSVVVVFAVIALVLFAISYLSRRRFGLLGLALAAGSILSSLWGDNASLLVNVMGLKSGPITTAITLSAIVLLPSVLLLFHGYAYKNFVSRFIGSFMFTLVAMAFLVQPLGYALSLQGFGASAYTWLAQNKDLIISFGMIFAVVDLFLTKPAHLAEKKYKH
jgi:hypothetical protein